MLELGPRRLTIEWTDMKKTETPEISWNEGIVKTMTEHCS